MKAALNRIFKKNLLILLALLAVLAGTKYSTIQARSSNFQRTQFFDEWSRAVAGMNDEEVDAFIDDLYIKLEEEEDRAYLSQLENDLHAFTSAITHQRDSRMLISFAQKLEGKLPIDSTPVNYVELLDYYAALDDPGLLPNDPVEMYFRLQDDSVVPVVVLFLSAVIWGVHYESEIYRYTGTTLHGRRYSSTTRAALLLIAVGVVLFNDLFDLWYSGILQSPDIWGINPMNHSRFGNYQMDLGLGGLLAVLLASKVLGALILCHVAECIARWKKNLKDTMIYSVMVLIALLLLGRIVKGNEWMPLLQIGMVNWYSMVAKIQIILPLGITALPLGLALNVLLEGTMVGLVLYANRRK